MSNDGIGCQSIEAVEERVEVGRAHSFSHRSRAADVGKQQRDRDLYPCHLLFAKHSYASRAESRIAGGLRVPRMPENEATQPGERSLANLAAWIGRNTPECPPLLGQARTLPGKHGPDLFRSPSLGRHLIKLRRKPPSRLRCDRCLALERRRKPWGPLPSSTAPAPASRGHPRPGIQWGVGVARPAVARAGGL